MKQWSHLLTKTAHFMADTQLFLILQQNRTASVTEQPVFSISYRIMEERLGELLQSYCKDVLLLKNKVLVNGKTGLFILKAFSGEPVS